MMPGGKSVFPTLTVRENLRLACWLKRKDHGRGRARPRSGCSALFPRLADRIDQLAGNLSGGEQQMLAVSQALIPDPKLLLIDELSLGLAPDVVGQLIEVVHQIHETGLTIVVVEQSINVALRLAERAVFMEKGEFRFTGSTQELLDRPDILRSVFIAGAVGRRGHRRGAKPKRPPQEGRRRSGGRRPTAARRPRTRRAGDPVECSGVVKRFGGITAVEPRRPRAAARARSSASSARTAPARRRCSTASPGSCPVDERPDPPRTARTSPTCRPTSGPRAGLGRSFQEARLFPSLTTAETLAVARERHLLSRGMVAAALGQPVAAARARPTSTRRSTSSST